jgi:valyl-tRNA synthetase
MDIKYDHIAAQITLQDKWATEKTFSPHHNPGPAYTIDTPPPTISGSLHIGHIFSYTQTDIIARYKRLSGYSVFYPFGFDDNGLPTERYVEQKCGVRAADLGRSAFINLCLEQTAEVEQLFKTLWQQIALSVDWDYWYSTISPESRRLSQLSFIKLYKAGFIYRKDEPAIYCTTCRTSVAQAELDELELPSFFNDIIFKDTEDNNLIVSTTRPELLYSTSALLYHPKDQRYQHLKNKNAIVPVYKTKIPIFADELVDPEKGTGLVMVSTFGDQNDIHWYKKHTLPLRLSIGLDGKWVAGSGITAGLKAPEARAAILAALAKEGVLAQQRPITHAVKVHERCKKEVEYNVLTQWFFFLLYKKKKYN